MQATVRLAIIFTFVYVLKLQVPGNANYLESIKLLQERFGQQHRVVSAHMQALLNITNPTNTLGQPTKILRYLRDTHRGLEALGKSHETYGDILIPIIHKKLTTDLIKTLAREPDNNEWKLNERQYPEK